MFIIFEREREGTKRFARPQKERERKRGEEKNHQFRVYNCYVRVEKYLKIVLAYSTRGDNLQLPRGAHGR